MASVVHRSYGGGAMLRFVLSLLVGACPGPAHASDEPWGAYLHDNQHTGRASFPLDPSALDDAPAWSAPAGYGMPLVVGDRVYAMRSQFGIGDDLTHVAAFELSTGELIWEEADWLIFPSAMAYHDGRLVYASRVWPSTEHFLFVRDASTGALIYDFPIPSSIVGMPTVLTEPDSGKVVAYLAAPAFTSFGNGPSMTAVRLRDRTASIEWTDPSPRHFGDFSVPTVVGSSLIVTGPAQYYAYDRSTGDVNHFHSGLAAGGGGATAAYDADRRQFYILEMLAETSGDLRGRLSAWSYENHDTIGMLWRSPEAVIESGSGVAIDDEGFVWAAGGDRLIKIDPDSGATVGTAFGWFANGIVPIVSADFVWTFDGSQIGETVVYDRRSLTEVRRFPGSRGSLNNPFGAPGALAHDAFILDYGWVYGRPGFDVYRRAPGVCGDAAGSDGVVGVIDALLVLRCAVGLMSCDLCVGDLDDSGAVTTTDVLLALLRAVGVPVGFECPPCS